MRKVSVYNSLGIPPITLSDYVFTTFAGTIIAKDAEQAINLTGGY